MRRSCFGSNQWEMANEFRLTEAWQVLLYVTKTDVIALMLSKYQDSAGALV